MLLWVRVDDFRALIYSFLEAYNFAKGQVLTLTQRPMEQAGPLMLYKLIYKGSLHPRFPVVRQTGNPLEVHHIS